MLSPFGKNRLIEAERLVILTHVARIVEERSRFRQFAKNLRLTIHLAPQLHFPPLLHLSLYAVRRTTPCPSNFRRSPSSFPCVSPRRSLSRRTTSSRSPQRSCRRPSSAK